MNIKFKTKISQRMIATIIIALLLFTNLAILSSKYMLIVIMSIGIGVLYCAYLLLHRIKTLRKIFNGFPFLWCITFAILMFLYGFFGSDKEAYSILYHFINVIYIFIFLIIFTCFKDYLVEVFAGASTITVYLISFYIIMMSRDDILNKIATGKFGNTAVGNVNTTTISYIFLLIPIVYMFLYKKEKKYLLPITIGCIFMFLTGSKKALIAVLIFIFLWAFESTNNKRKIVNNIVVFLILMICIVLLCLYNPYLYSLIGERFVSMFQKLILYDANDNSSTSLRMTFIITALKECWDRPLFGHGWNSYANMYGWNSLYQTNLYTHCNYTEILFSFGLFGMLIYYWFPILTVCKVNRCKDAGKKFFAKLMCLELLFIDMGTVSCYSSILGFIGFIIAYVLINNSEKSNNMVK